MKDIVISIIEGKQKAVVGGAVAGILTLLALVGVNGDLTVKEALVALGNLALTHFAVHQTENK
jgi:hypothetical protein